jgi:hypothetical protein
MGFCFPFTSDLKVLLEEQRAKRDAMHRKGLICPSVSTYDSRPFKRYKRAWKTACLKAGSPGRYHTTSNELLLGISSGLACVRRLQHLT